jgi:hypothetical protein
MIEQPQTLPAPNYRWNPRYPDAMPETRVERILFGVAALVIAALVALIVLETTDRFGAPRRAGRSGADASDHRAGDHDRTRDDDGRDDGGVRTNAARRKRRQAEIERDRRHMGRDSLRFGRWRRALLGDPPAGER